MERPAVNTCCKCGRWVCMECHINIEGHDYCKECVKDLINNGHNTTHSCSGSGDRKGTYFVEPKKQYNGVLLFILSCIMPGIGYMYLGLIKRGLFFLASFFITAYLAASLDIGFIGLAIPVMWITSMFDGFKKMRQLIAGEYVEDSVEDIMMFLRKNKMIISIFAGVLFIIWFLG